ncbi:hypothetical protein BC940DRAFT_176329 [Gongronella butleri]|nr:hypothetical protein BC940DRAFT_176329 [Gongronella butleri]
MIASQAIELANKYIDVPFWQETISSLVHRLTDTKGKRWTLGAAIALVLTGEALYAIAQPPKHLRNLPRVGLFPVLYHTIFSKSTNRDIYKQLYEPLAMKHKLHVRFDRSSWSVIVTDPMLANQVLVKSGKKKKKKSRKRAKSSLFA